MSKPNVSKKPARRRVSFSYYAPRAKEVLLLGDFNNWDAKARPMKKNADGLWQKNINLHPGRYEYRFLVDNKWCCDPRHLERCPNCFGSENSIIEVAKRK